MAFNTHYTLNETYVKNEKVSTIVVFWVVPKIFEDDEVNFNLCPGEKTIYIYHKLKAGYYEGNCKGCCGVSGLPSPCVDEFLSFVKRLYPGYDIYGNKDFFKNNYRRKKCVDVDVECQSGKSPVKK